MTVLAVIPARWASVRFPGKVLTLLEEKPLLQWVYEKAIQCPHFGDVLIATDDERVMVAANQIGAKVIRTSSRCRTGSDRVAEVVAQISSEQVVNIQADYPDIHPEDLSRVSDYLLENPKIPMVTLAQEFEDLRTLSNPHRVKVICDPKGFAVEFVRNLPAYTRPERTFEHIGVYGFQRDCLLRFSQWPQSPLELKENLEQLRVSERGIPIKVLITTNKCHGINLPEDKITFLKLRKKETIKII